MKISTKKFYTILSTIALIVAQFISFSVFQNKVDSVETSLVLASSLCIFAMCVNIISWKYLTGELLCPYIVFLLVLFIFCCGQSIGWFTGINMGPKDMWDRVDHGMTKELLLRGLCYSSQGISFFHLGAIIACKSHDNYVKENVFESDRVETAYRNLGKLLLLISIPAFLVKTYEAIITVMQGGYSAIYSYRINSSTFMQICNILGNYYQPCLLLLLIAYRNNAKYRKCIITAMIFDVIANLYIGGRSSAVMVMLAIILAYHYFVQSFNRKQISIGIVGGYLGIAVLNAVADIRGSSGRGFLDVITALRTSFTNVIGEFIGELGWSITSICWTMELVPTYGLRHGMSYLVSLISWVPSFVFTGTHPVVKWGELSNWLQSALNMSYGPGFSMIAEAYLNFGNFGFIALLVEGIVIGKLIARVSKKNTEQDLLGSTFQILIIMVLMKSLVRSSVSIATRQAFFVILPLYVIIRLSLGKDTKT